MTKVGVARLAFVVIVFSALELLCRLGIITRVTMIPPSEMVTSLWDIVESGRFNSDISFTFFNVVAAAIVAIGIGFLLGAGLHSLPRLRRPLEPLLSAYYAIPTFVFYPLLRPARLCAEPFALSNLPSPGEPGDENLTRVRA
jgi:NitT/TauT family transport system permease protein